MSKLQRVILTPELARSLAQTAAVMAVSHNELSVLVGGTEDRRSPVDVLEAVILDVLLGALNRAQEPVREPEQDKQAPAP